MGRVSWLQSHVRQCLQDVWEVCRVQVDDDGDVPFRAGAAGGWIAVVDGDPAIVRVWAHAAFGVKPTAPVLREINDANGRGRTAHVYWYRGAVIVEQTLHADGVDAATLGQAWSAVCAAANELGPMLTAVHGGCMPFSAEDEAAEDREAG